MSEKQIFFLLGQFWQDLQRPGFYWEVLALALILAVSWWLTYRLRTVQKPAGDSAQSALRAFGVGSLKRIAFPVLALILVLVLRKTLTVMQLGYLSLLDMSVRLLVSWVLVRVLVRGH